MRESKTQRRVRKEEIGSLIVSDPSLHYKGFLTGGEYRK